MQKFDYEAKVWGDNKVSLSPVNLSYFHLKYALEALKNTKGRVLDLGCGAGGITRAIKNYRPDLEVWGIDVSQTVIERAKKNPREVTFKAASVYETGFPDEYFDALVHFDVFEHLDTPQLAVKEGKRILKKEGIIHGYVPCEGENSAYTKWVRKFGWRGKEIFCGHNQPYSFASLQTLFTENGFEILRKRNYGYLIYQLTDFFFFSWLLLRGKNLDSSIETLVANNQKSLPILFLGKIKQVISFCFFVESSLLSFLPGFGLHLTVGKKL